MKILTKIGKGWSNITDISSKWLARLLYELQLITWDYMKLNKLAEMMKSSITKWLKLRKCYTFWEKSPESPDWWFLNSSYHESSK